jgi:predicted acyltransferase
VIAEPATPVHRRARGLDVLRGLTVGWLLVVVYTPTSGLRGHARWFGWDHSDVFFPLFVLLAGMGLALQTRERVPWGRLLRRFVVLVVLGLLVNAWLGAGPDLSQLRVTGVLQRIALAGLAGALVVTALRRSWPAVLAAAAVTALGWGLLLRAAAADCPGDLPTPEGCGTFFAVDRDLFGAAHVYAAGRLGHDPEGLVSTLGALATFLAGYAAAALLHRLRSRPAGVRSAALLAMATGWALAWPLLDQLQPVAKRLWTPSFVASHAALGVAVLAVAVLVFDSDRPTWLTRALDAVSWPVIALGRNALVLWIGVFVVGQVLVRTPVAGVPLGEHLLAEHGPVGFFALTAGSWLAVASAMHAARWYVRL